MAFWEWDNASPPPIKPPKKSASASCLVCGGAACVVDPHLLPTPHTFTQGSHLLIGFNCSTETPYQHHSRQPLGCCQKFNVRNAAFCCLKSSQTVSFDHLLNTHPVGLCETTAEHNNLMRSWRCAACYLLPFIWQLPPCAIETAFVKKGTVVWFWRPIFAEQFQSLLNTDR